MSIIFSWVIFSWMTLSTFSMKLQSGVIQCAKDCFSIIRIQSLTWTKTWLERAANLRYEILSWVTYIKSGCPLKVAWAHWRAPELCYWSKNFAMFESLCSRTENYNQGNGTLVHRQVVNAINETKRKIDRRENLSAAGRSESLSAARQIDFSWNHMRCLFFVPGIKLKHKY